MNDPNYNPKKREYEVEVIKTTTYKVRVFAYDNDDAETKAIREMEDEVSSAEPLNEDYEVVDVELYYPEPDIDEE